MKCFAITPVHVKFIPDQLEECILYISLEYKTASHLCACGCKEEVVTPLTNDGWELSDNNGVVSLSPSIGNWKFECRSHYMITDNTINLV